MNNLFVTLLNALKAKLVPIWTKLKLWCNISFLKTQLVNKVRIFFSAMLNVKPRDQKDYYPFFGWLISRRLAFAVILVIGVLGAYYVFYVNPPSVFQDGDGIRTYSYNSVPLRFTSGQVRIKAKSGYIAYEGNVEKGRAEGSGSLYGREGNEIYTGAFSDNKFNGKGRLFYQNGQLKYEGEFEDNEYSGEGRLYRENGSLEYEGNFLKGKKEGTGVLYDSGNHAVYTGSFTKDRIRYEEMLGKSAKDIASMYTGQRTMYAGEETSVVVLEDIQALYKSSQGEELDGEKKAEELYILDNQIQFGDYVYTSLEELGTVLGQPVYEGNSYVTMAEAVGLEYLNQKGITLLPPASLEKDTVYNDVIQITKFDEDYMLYLYTYEYEGLLYSFYCKSRYGEFAMYRIEKAETR